MSLPKQLRAFNLFVDGNSFVGEVQSITLPKLSRKFETFRAGGMPVAVNLDMGFDDSALDLEFTIAGIAPDITALIGKGLNASGLRFAGSFQQDDTGQAHKVDINVRGRIKEADTGEFKAGELVTSKYSMHCAYFRYEVNDELYYEIDALNGICNIKGVDIEAVHRQNIGL